MTGDRGGVRRKLTGQGRGGVSGGRSGVGHAGRRELRGVVRGKLTGQGRGGVSGGRAGGWGWRVAAEGSGSGEGTLMPGGERH